MTSRELLRKLRRLGVTIDPARGKGGHIMVRHEGRRSIIPTGSGEMRRGTLLRILRDLGLRQDDLQ
jgi:predicted RNA binding protein YcfA (HicA-like mRNA interferase family)